MKNWVLFQGILFALIGIALVYLTFSKVSFGEVIGVIQTGNFFVLIPIFIVSFLVLVVRVWRWKLLYKQSKIE
ncbi:MAG: lysylphosphatidylglycerol synthase domain-containing protein, partial [Bacteroidia bacterium]